MPLASYKPLMGLLIHPDSVYLPVQATVVRRHNKGGDRFLKGKKNSNSDNHKNISIMIVAVIMCQDDKLSAHIIHSTYWAYIRHI